MGIIGFTQTMHGVGGTANLLAIGTYLSEQLGHKVLLIQTRFTMNNLDRPLIGNLANQVEMQSRGLDAFIATLKGTRMSETLYSENAIDITDNLHVLLGSKTTDQDTYNSEIYTNAVRFIIQSSVNYYDDVLVDISSGISDLKAEYVSVCDTIVYTVRQETKMISDILASEKTKKILEKKKLLFIVNNYCETSKYSLLRISRQAHIKKDAVCGIPYSVQFHDSVIASKVIKYMRGLNERSEPVFYRLLGETVNTIIKLTQTKNKAIQELIYDFGTQSESDDHDNRTKPKITPRREYIRKLKNAKENEERQKSEEIQRHEDERQLIEARQAEEDLAIRSIEVALCQNTEQLTGWSSELNDELTDIRSRIQSDMEAKYASEIDRLKAACEQMEASLRMAQMETDTLQYEYESQLAELRLANEQLIMQHSQTDEDRLAAIAELEKIKHTIETKKPKKLKNRHIRRGGVRKSRYSA